jgi:hypothetical protein
MISFLVWLFVKTLVLFLAAANGKRINDAGQLTLFWKVIVIPLAAVFMVYDITFNLILGTIMYLELPRWGEWTFSARTRRLYRANSWVARFWRKQINIFLPGHIEL